MILTGKAKEDFLKWTKQGNLVNIMADVYLHALIIEWFDSVGIYIEVGVYPEENGDINFSYTIYGDSSSDNFEFYNERQEATKEAILKANEIYNENERKSK